jgi:hypothetical protein
MMKNKKGINLFEVPVKAEQLFQIFNISVFIKQAISYLEIPDKIICQQHNPLVKKNFVHLQYEKC